MARDSSAVSVAGDEIERLNAELLNERATRDLLEQSVRQLAESVSEWREIYYRRERAERELVRVIYCIKSGKRPPELVSKGYFIGLKKGNVTEKEAS